MTLVRYFFPVVVRPDTNITEKIKKLGSAYLIIFWSMIGLAVFVGIESAVMVATTKNTGIVLHILKTNDGVRNNIFFYYHTILYAPIIEELTFRLFLKFSPIKIAISLGGAVAMVMNLLDYSYTNIFICVAATIILSYVCVSKSRFYKIFETQTSTIYIISAVSFGLVHIVNYRIDLDFIWGYPIVLFPNIVAGFVFSSIRMRFGILWSIILHSFTNIVAVIFSFIF